MDLEHSTENYDMAA